MAALTLNDFTFLIDTREQLPWNFALLDDVSKKIRTKSKRASLKTGDYSIEGFPEICVERKSKDDLLGCCGQSRERFEDCLHRMQEMPFRCVIVECSWQSLYIGNWISKILPQQVIGSVLGWSQWGIPFFLRTTSKLHAYSQQILCV